MIIIPAIDIMDKKPVRLYQGDYEKKEVVGNSVLQMAQYFEKIGASYLHLVDLDGAKSGSKTNHECIAEVCKKVKIPVQVGGGIRTIESIDYYLNEGVSRIILGTKALEDPSFLKEVLAKYNDKIAVGVDVKDGYVYGRGWLQASKVKIFPFIQSLCELGVKTIIVTDISKDGTLAGVNIKLYEQIQEMFSIDVIASGGIKDLKDIEQLKALNIYGAISGKAMYHKTLSLTEAIKVCEE